MPFLADKYMENEKPIIKVSNISRVFTVGKNSIHALKSVDFEVEAGSFVSITGRSGSGKSTLLYQLGLLDRPTAGTIHIEGSDVTKMDEDERTIFRLKELGYVFQDYALLPSLTAAENVMTPLLMMGYSKKEAMTKAAESLEKIGLADRMHNLPGQLSGGQQQRAAIARAIAHEPVILFADEPTANLDSETSLTVLKAFLDLHKAGQTIIMVTHEKEYAAMTDRIITLSDGVILSDEEVNDGHANYEKRHKTVHGERKK